MIEEIAAATDWQEGFTYETTFCDLCYFPEQSPIQKFLIDPSDKLQDHQCSSTGQEEGSAEGMVLNVVCMRWVAHCHKGR